MGKFAVIGLGSFGEYVAKSLMEQGNEVLVIDKDPTKVQRIKDLVSSAMTANAADKGFLEEVDIADVDAVIISLSEAQMAASILTTMHLKELGIKNIIVKVASDDHKIILEKVGATRTVFPERDVAERLASTISSANVYEQIPLSNDMGILEIVAPSKFVVDRLADLDMRTKHAVQVLFLRRPTRQLAPGDMPQREECQVLFPDKDTPIKPGDILILAGNTEALEKIKDLKPSI